MRISAKKFSTFFVLFAILISTACFVSAQSDPVVVISPKPALQDDDLTCSATINSRFLNYYWYKDGVKQDSLTTYQTTSRSVVLNSAYTSAGDTWECEVISHPVPTLSARDSVSIESVDPVNVTIIPDPAYTNDSLICEKDIESAYYELNWYLDSVPQPTLTTNTVDSSNTIKGQVWTCEIVHNLVGIVVGSDNLTISNSPPIVDAVGIITTYEEIPVNITFTGSDIDAGDTLAFGIAAAPTNGVISSLNPNTGEATYSPNPNFDGTDSFTFYATDGTANSTTSIVNISITPSNDPPIANNVVGNTDEDTQVIITLNYTEIDTGDQAETCAVPNIVGGTETTSCACVSGVCTVGLTPSLDSTSDITADYTVNDGDANSNTANIIVTVNPVNDAPLITGQVALSTPEETSLGIFVENLTIADPDNVYPTDFTLIILSGPNYSFIGNVITPYTDFNGDLTVFVRVNDSQDIGDIFNLIVTVTPINDIPVFNPALENQNVNEGFTLTYDINASNVDPSDVLTFSSNITMLGGSIDPATGVLTWIPNNNDVGSHTVEAAVCDDSGAFNNCTSGNFDITVNDIPFMASAGGPYAGLIGSPITFSAFAAGGSVPYQYRWDLNNNGSWTAWSSNQDINYAWDYIYTGTVKLEVNDSTGSLESADTTVATYNLSANGPYSGTEGSPILFSGSLSGGLPPYQFRWDFDNDGLWDTMWASTAGASYTWYDDYTGSVVLQASDSLGALLTSTSNVNVSNAAPTANADGPYACIPGENITLYGYAIDPGNDAFNYSWDLDNNGTYETIGQNAAFTCSTIGTYPVSLRAEDEDGGIGLDLTYVVVNIPTLLIDADGPYSGAEGFAISFSGSASGGLAPYQFRWDFDNNGIWDTTWALTADSSYIYNDDYSGIAVLEVNDFAGNTAIDTSTVSVNNLAPTAEANGPYPCGEGESITLTGSATDYGSDIFTYTWDLNNDGTYETTGQNPIYTCGASGSYTINLQVSDDDGGSNTDSTVVNVGIMADTTPPIVAINSPQPIIYNVIDILFDISASDGYGIDKIWYGLSYYNGAIAGYTFYTGAVNITFLEEGVFTLTAYANDTSGNIGSASFVFTVNTSQPYIPPTPEEPKPVYKAKIEKIRMSNDGFLTGDEDLRTTISLSNIGDNDLDNTRISVVIPELGIWKRIGPFDLDEGDKVTREIVLDVPDDAEPGEYVARIVVSNSKTRRVVHRHIIIE